MKHLRTALEEHKKGSGWIGVDLDGTLADYQTGDGVDGIGAPIAPMVDLVKGLLEEGQEVRIFTARVGTDDDDQNQEQEKMIGLWTERIFGQRLAVTCKKDPGMIRLYDDRAIQVIKNTGEIVAA